MSKNSGLTSQEIITIQPMTAPAGNIFFGFSYEKNENINFVDPIDLEASFEKGLEVTMHDFKDGDVVHVMDHNGNIIDIGIYLGKKRINNIQHWLILSGKGYRELNTSFHSLLKSEPIEENK